ncbi:hypothetical protein BB561_003129 [Smittium simulii]|uniref:Uncharacterized protein n=1 Tax=Smittium simulii TaxID=133385 RepID=A0A2T9YMS5_9FUNG|nr:hypothetical protein BB561_003129 [Smittium simulii]
MRQAIQDKGSTFRSASFILILAQTLNFLTKLSFSNPDFNFLTKLSFSNPDFNFLTKLSFPTPDFNFLTKPSFPNPDFNFITKLSFSNPTFNLLPTRLLDIHQRYFVSSPFNRSSISSRVFINRVMTKKNIGANPNCGFDIKEQSPEIPVLLKVTFKDSTSMTINPAAMSGDDIYNMVCKYAIKLKTAEELGR